MNISQTWPPGLPFHLELPQTSLYYNLEVSAQRYPDRAAIIYYGSTISYAELKRQVDALAGFLQQRCHAKQGDPVALYMQNSPQFIIAYYAILRIGGIVVPMNAMSVAREIAHIVQDSGCQIIIYGQELDQNLAQLPHSQLTHCIVVNYHDYCNADTDLPFPEIISPTCTMSCRCRWQEVLLQNLSPIAIHIKPEDLAILPYTSGSTGKPKGCMHTHRNVMHTAVAAQEWSRSSKDNVVLAALPMFHVAGMQNGVNTPIYNGNTIVIMTRWDKRCAALLIERYQVSAWSAISSMLCDFLNQSDIEQYDLSSLRVLTGGGAAMPKAVAEKIYSLWGIHYIEGYGLTETMAPTHMNPIHRPKTQCLGIPIFDTVAIIVDPETLQPLPAGEVGEVFVQGPQVFLGYHNNPRATEEAFVQVDGQSYFRTGDLAYVDDEGYFFMVDRLKRMINAAGYKVWPAEVESLLYAHPAVLEACVISCRDAQRGENVKALIVLKPGHHVDEPSLVTWARGQMAAYKVPRVVEFRDRLPKSASGKLLWRELQERENAKV